MSAAALLASHSAPVPADIWERTADVVAIWAAARRTREGRALEALFAGSPDLEISGRAAIVRYSEADPIHVPSCMTADAIAVPVALVAATNAQGYLEAVTVGAAVGVRLARAVGGVDALSSGVWPALFAAPAVAAVTDAMARGLPSSVVENALALSMSGGSGRAGRPGGMPSGRWTIFGEAAYRGLRAVRAAESGATADAAIFSTDWLRALIGELATPEAMAGEARDTEFCIKPAVCARQGLTAVAGLREILAEVSSGTIESVEVRLPTSCIGIVTRPVVEGNRLSEVANLPLALALAALDPRRLLDIGRESAISPEVVAFAARVSVIADPSLDGARAGTWPAILRLDGTNGRREQRFDTMPGDAGAPSRASALHMKLSCLGAQEVLAALMNSSEEDPETILARFRAVSRS